ncbi:hypothetical protein SNEBB_006408 [Seison nebaliae]|nr:hypothetical protein SNEBB_006408 [Seison nebaliae]
MDEDIEKYWRFVNLEDGPIPLKSEARYVFITNADTTIGYATAVRLLELFYVEKVHTRIRRVPSLERGCKLAEKILDALTPNFRRRVRPKLPVLSLNIVNQCYFESILVASKRIHRNLFRIDYVYLIPLLPTTDLFEKHKKFVSEYGDRGSIGSISSNRTYVDTFTQWLGRGVISEPFFNYFRFDNFLNPNSFWANRFVGRHKWQTFHYYTADNIHFLFMTLFFSNFVFLRNLDKLLSNTEHDTYIIWMVGDERYPQNITSNFSNIFELQQNELRFGVLVVIDAISYTMNTRYSTERIHSGICCTGTISTDQEIIFPEDFRKLSLTNKLVYKLNNCYRNTATLFATVGVEAGINLFKKSFTKDKWMRTMKYRSHYHLGRNEAGWMIDGKDMIPTDTREGIWAMINSLLRKLKRMASISGDLNHKILSTKFELEKFKADPNLKTPNHLKLLGRKKSAASDQQDGGNDDDTIAIKINEVDVVHFYRNSLDDGTLMVLKDSVLFDEQLAEDDPIFPNYKKENIFGDN